MHGAHEGIFRSLFDAGPHPGLVVDQSGQIVLANARASQLLGVHRDDLIGRAVEEFIVVGAPWTQLAETVGGQEERLEGHARHRDGSDVPLSVIVTPLADGGEVLLSLTIAAAERTRAAELLVHEASHDPLTGLPNRSLFLDRLEHALARARRSRRPLAVVFLDLDDFKLVNDTRGHDIGDLLLVTMTPKLAAALRPGDTIARFGGDEFVVLCEDLQGTADAIGIAKRITDACSVPLRVADYEHVVSISAGIALADDPDGASPSGLLRDADAAMYRAKARGKGYVEVFDERMRARLIERIAIERSLRKAIERDELSVFYQPVMSLRRQKIVSVEALLRWRHPQRGLLEPSAFIAVAESSGLIVRIGEWVLEQACRQAVHWRNAAPEAEPIRISVNLSAQQLIRSDIAESVSRILELTGLDPGLLELEITESMLLQDIETCAQALLELKALGVRLVVDDFGSGYSSLAYLKRLTIDALKIDRSFVDSLSHEDEDGAIIGAVLGMASALDIAVTAEGVETPAQLSRLRNHGCDCVQGFLFSRPGPPQQIAPLIGVTDSDDALLSA